MEKKKYKIIIGILVLISIFFRIIVIEKTPVNDTTQIDAEMGNPKTVEEYDQLYNLEIYDLNDVGHFYYIMHLYKNHNLSDNSLGQTYHPPIHYILSATWLRFLDNFQLNSMQKVEGLQYLGLIYYKMAPGYFNPKWHYEYGGLYGVTLSKKYLEIIEKYRTDKEEVEKLAFYSAIKGKEPIAMIDEKLLEYWK